MSIAEARAQTRRFRPDIGPTLSTWAIRLFMGVVMIALCLTVIGITPLLTIGLFFTAVALAFPKLPGAWALALVIAILSVAPVGQPVTWKFFVALAGAHALHVFGMTQNWLPVSGRVQLAVVLRGLRKYLVVQVIAQLIAAVIIYSLGSADVRAELTSPVFGIVAAVALVVLVIAVLVPVIRKTR
jgi:hypothetical protein